MKIIVLAGLPRSGKSSWARQQQFPIVCPDAVRLALHGERFNVKAEIFVWPIVFVMAEALLKAGNETIVIDATNTTERRRVEWSKRFPEAEIELKVFDTSPAECKHRAIKDNQEDLLPVIDRMASEWDLPKPASWAA